MKVHVLYFAQLRQQSGTGEESIETSAETVRELFQEVGQRHSLTLSARHIKAARNEAFCSMETALAENDTIAFMPPMSGG